MEATIRKNSLKNGIEVLFASIPDAGIRSQLKSKGFRWSSRNKLWYAKDDAERWEFVQTLGETQADALNEFSGVSSEGYLGAIEWTGSKFAKESLYGAELSKAIRNDLRDLLPIPRSHVNVSVESYSGGQSIYVTLKLEREKFAVPREEYVARFNKNNAYELGCYDRILIEDDTEISTHEFYDLPDERKDEIVAFVAETYAKRYIDEEKCYYTTRPWHNSRENNMCPFNKNASIILDAVYQVLDSYNHDDTNSMVDYFDRHFYESVYVVWL